jgi:hypothetical protein
MQIWFQDSRFACRMLRKNALSTVVILVSLAVGVGANSAIFSVVDALLLRPLPYPQPGCRMAAFSAIGISPTGPRQEPLFHANRP